MSQPSHKHKRSCLWCFCLKLIHKQTAIWCNKHKWERIVDAELLWRNGRSEIKSELGVIADSCPDFDSEEYALMRKERFR